MQEQIDKLNKELQSLKDEFYRNNFSNTQDFYKFSSFKTRLRVPVVTALPTTAQIGELCSFGGILYTASSTNTWTKVGLQS